MQGRPKKNIARRDHAEMSRAKDTLCAFPHRKNRSQSVLGLLLGMLWMAGPASPLLGQNDIQVGLANPAAPPPAVQVEVVVQPAVASRPGEPNAADRELRDNPHLAAIIQQYSAQYDGLLQAELNLAILVGEFSQVQRDELRQAARNALHAYARELASRRIGNLAPAIANRPDVRVTLPEMSDPQEFLEKTVLTAFRELATPEQLERFQAERTKRLARLKRVIISNIVTGVDEQVLLTPQQRQQLTDLIGQHWNAPNPQLLDQFTFPNNNGWIPISDSLVVSIFTPTQRRAWTDRRNRHTVVFNAVGGAGQGAIAIDDAMWQAFDRDEPEGAR